MVIDRLVLKEGFIFLDVYFDGKKADLEKAIKESIQSGQFITFTYVPEGRTKEINISGSSISFYETDPATKTASEFNLPETKKSNVILFPTVGYASILNDQQH